MRKTILLFLAFVSALAAGAQDVETHKQYLSGRGADSMVKWDFYCAGGRNSGKWTKIGVPSCWELQGFGTYQYGVRFSGAHPEGIADEHGLYKYEFTLPESWQGRQIELVFEAVMTDARVKINGRKAGKGLHQGGFCPFRYDVSDRVFFGKKKNRLELDVAKESEDGNVNLAERRGDYWNFGGIIRPVYIISKPAQNISRVAINALMDGTFNATAYLNRAVAGASVLTEILDSKGRVVAKGSTDCRSSDHADVCLKADKPKLWSAETPNLYTARFSLLSANGKVLHIEEQKFGFRTIEYRASDGVYINGHKVIFKGVNRHSFRPESGRTLSKTLNIEDVNTIKAMNMNAVRLSHYPADPEFYEACDSLGLYVLDELPGWHGHHGTVIGSQLVKDMVTRDVNYPCIIFWDNGNEGGFNYELEPVFHEYDPQNRVVLYPWSNRNGFETVHYRSWGETQEYMRKPEIFMPTEFLHGLYDGGHGAGLADYWKIMMQNPRCAGGFLWDYADEAVVRTDQNGQLDCQGNFGADGIVGPHLEREGSFYTIKEVWSPVELNLLSNGKLEVKNHYDFLNLNTVNIAYEYVKMPKPGEEAEKVLAKGSLPKADVPAHGSHVFSLPQQPSGCDAMRVSVVDGSGRNVITRVFANPVKYSEFKGNGGFKVSENGDEIMVSGNGMTYNFSKQTGYLKGITVGPRTISLVNGPRFVAARRSDRSFDQFYNHDDKDAEKKKTEYTLYNDQGKFSGFSVKESNGFLTLTARYALGTLDSVSWKFGNGKSVEISAFYNFGGVVDEMGVMFDYPEDKVQSKSWVGAGPYRVWQNRMQGPEFGYWSNKYNDPIPGESWEYPEFKGYFANVRWMTINTSEGKMTIEPLTDNQFVGVYQPRDGRDHLLYTLPQTGISLMRVIPSVRNKVNTTDLNGPSAQPFWAKNEGYVAKFNLTVE